ncbi:hypothetical protein ACIP98_41080 [Streptomyces sp. NPDC088354]|uniref:hypothetical protein n=1 Tax=Streptomyces sp. NPDC088354 TaxID=3365856 RepID=UPI00380E478D
MDAKAYNASLAELRGMRDEIRALTKELETLQRKRDKQVVALGAYEKAKADRIAPAAGLSVRDVAFLVPSLAPAGGEPTPAGPAEAAPPAPVQAPGVVAPSLRPPAVETSAAVAPASHDMPESEASTAAAAATLVPPAPVPAVAEPAVSAGLPRELPSIPAGERGDAWVAAAPNLVSRRPNFPQDRWDTAFLDAETGQLVYKTHSAQLDLGSRSAGEILAAVTNFLPDSVVRIYITAGDPWHRNVDRYPHMKDAVTAWLNAPAPGWKVSSGKGKSKGKDLLAGHFAHERHPIGRWQQGDRHLELASIGAWFDPEGADPTMVRDAFLRLWEALRTEWSDVVIMGSPTRTGKDLWSRTIPTKTGAKWADGYPVMSIEIRGLLHATAGQGRAELITPPRVPEQLPQLTELDRTFAYAKHAWSGGVGVPERITPAIFAAMSDKEKANALYRPSHWQVRVTIPKDWNHVGLLPAPVTGEAGWSYPSEPGRTFTTWAGGAEINLALRNHLSPWKIEILDGLRWEAGAPLREWRDKLVSAWKRLRAQAVLHAAERERLVAHMASRAVRAILLYGLGGFAQRPRVTTGTTAIGDERLVPAGAQIVAVDAQTITWERTVFSDDPYAHPEWAAGVWSGARAALLSTKVHKEDQTQEGASKETVEVGALHLPPGSIVAFRTDAIYTTADVTGWPYHEQPGDYLVKGYQPGPLAAPTTLSDLMDLKASGREYLAKARSEGAR